MGAVAMLQHCDQACQVQALTQLTRLGLTQLTSVTLCRCNALTASVSPMIA